MVWLWHPVLAATCAILLMGSSQAKPSLEHLENCNVVVSSTTESAQCAPIPVETQDAAFGDQRNWIGRLVAGLQIPLFGGGHQDEEDGEEAEREESGARYQSSGVNTLQFEDEIVLRFVVVSDKEQATLLGAAETLLLDVWNIDGANVDVRIHRRRVKDLLKMLPKPLRNPERREQLIADLQQVVVSNYPLVSYGESNVQLGKSFFKDYRNLAAIEGFLELVAKKYSNVKIKSVGNTFQGREIKSVVVKGSHSRQSTKGKIPTIMVVSGVQARDWIAVSSTLYSILQVAKNAPTETDYIFIPVMNPDGYVHTWEYDRLWRKNRQPTGVPMCSGIDIDHSFYQDWQSGSRTPCSEYYGGKKPLEALEALAFSQYINESVETHDLVGFIQLQSYSSQIVYADSQSLEFLRRWVPAGSDYSVLSLREAQGHIEGSLLETMAQSHGISAVQIKLPIDYQGILVPRTYITTVGESVYKVVSRVGRVAEKGD